MNIIQIIPNTVRTYAAFWVEPKGGDGYYAYERVVAWALTDDYSEPQPLCVGNTGLVLPGDMNMERRTFEFLSDSNKRARE